MTLDDLSALVRERYPQGAVSVARRGMALVVCVHATPPPADLGAWPAVAAALRLHAHEAAATLAAKMRRRAA